MGSKQKSKSLWGIILFCLFFLALFPTQVFADFGPKSSTKIRFSNAEEKTYYVSFLSSSQYFGMSMGQTKDDMESPYKNSSEKNRDWEKFAEAVGKYTDKDNYVYITGYHECVGNDAVDTVTADSFKILVYFPDTDTLVVSSVCETYAMTSYFIADLSKVSSGTIKVEKTPQYMYEVTMFIDRIAITILLELFIAKKFGYSSLKAEKLIIFTNIGTQILLNVALNVLAPHLKIFSSYILMYLAFEFVVFFNRSPYIYDFFE